MPKVDSWVLIYCAVLVVVAFGAIAWMVRQAHAGAHELEEAAKRLRKLPGASREDQRLGRSAEDWDALSEAGLALPGRARELFALVDAVVEPYIAPVGRSEEDEGEEPPERYFATASVEQVLSSGVVLPKYYDAGLFHTVPGVLTSLGLLGTFVAILVGLGGLTVDGQTNAILGIKTLIENLSGKFVTSVAALSLSVLFVGLEQAYAKRRLRAAHGTFVRALADRMPVLSSTRVLLDIQRQSVHTTRSISHISADLVERVTNAFRGELGGEMATGLSSSLATKMDERMGPTLDAVKEGMGALRETISRLETGKAESVVGQIETLTTSLERSLRESLAEMGRQFQEALTGSTKQEFGDLAQVIRGSVGLLEGVNTGFAEMQGTLKQVLEQARSTTDDQLRAGMEQSRQLGVLVEGLMTRLDEKASQNMDQVASALTGVVTDLSSKVTQLSEDLVARVGAVTAESQAAASRSREAADAWTAHSGAQLAQLIETLREKSTDFEAAGETLLQAQQMLAGTLQQNNAALSEMKSAAEQVRTYTLGLSGLQKEVTEGQRTQAQLATRAADSVARLTEAAQRHGEFLDRYQATYEAYNNAFAHVDQRVAALLDDILKRLADYNRLSEQNFTMIVQSANKVVPMMAEKLKASSDQLREQIDELSDVLDKGLERLRA